VCSDPRNKVIVTQRIGRTSLADEVYRFIGGKPFEQQDQGSDQARSVPACLAANQHALSAGPVPISGSDGVGEVVLIEVNFVVVNESEADFFDVPIEGTCRRIECDDGVEVRGRDGGGVDSVAGHVVIGGSPHPQAGEDFAPESVAHNVAVVRASKSFQLLRSEECGFHGGPFSGAH